MPGSGVDLVMVGAAVVSIRPNGYLPQLQCFYYPSRLDSCYTSIQSGAVSTLFTSREQHVRLDIRSFSISRTEGRK